jgi:DNA polymerase-3 subunit beta
MKFVVSSTELQRALAKVGNVIPTRSTMPILENMLFDLLNNTLTITVTDLEISQMISLEVEGKEDGRVAIPAKRLTETVRALPDNLKTSFDIDITSNKIRITTDTGEYSLSGESAKEYPPVPQFKGMVEFTMDAPTLKKIIHRTAFAVSSDELRPAMMGVLFQGKEKEFRAVATDGHRLVRYAQSIPASTSLKHDIIVPAKALNLVNRSLEGGNVTISVSDTHIRFAFDKTILVSRLIDETYPNYESVIPQDSNKALTISRDATVSSVRRVALYASATTHQVKLDIRKSGLTVSAQDLDFGGEAKEKVKCEEYTGDDLEIGFNSGYLIDVLTHLDSEKVTMKFSSATRAGLVSPAEKNNGEDVVMLVMPVRLNI